MDGDRDILPVRVAHLLLSFQSVCSGRDAYNKESLEEEQKGVTIKLLTDEIPRQEQTN